MSPPPRERDAARQEELVDDAKSQLKLGKLRVFGSAEGFLSPLAAGASQAAGVELLRHMLEQSPAPQVGSATTSLPVEETHKIVESPLAPSDGAVSTTKG
jgi:hypothetical protein